LKGLAQAAGEVPENDLRCITRQEPGRNSIHQTHGQLAPLDVGPGGNSRRQQQSDRHRDHEEHEKRNQIFDRSDDERVERLREEEIE
jgi:hypothetical protein